MQGYVEYFDDVDLLKENDSSSKTAPQDYDDYMNQAKLLRLQTSVTKWRVCKIICDFIMNMKRVVAVVDYFFYLSSHK